MLTDTSSQVSIKGVDYVHLIINYPLTDFKTFLRPCSAVAVFAEEELKVSIRRPVLCSEMFLGNSSSSLGEPSLDSYEGLFINVVRTY